MIGVMDSVKELTEIVGQNRMELLLFKLTGRNQRYGINVFKVREVLPCPRLTRLPRLQKYVVGVARIRGQTISVIDLALAIGSKIPADPEKSFIVIAEYNRSTQGFLVSGVERIVNLNWSQILPPPNGVGHSNYMTAVTEINKELVEILDVEKILEEISPARVKLQPQALSADEEFANFCRAHHVTVMVADDSLVARKQIKGALAQLGIDTIEASDGLKALNMLREFVQDTGNIASKIKLVISDVEMPEMDGYTLTASIRQDPALKNLYVIMHSSLSGVFNISMVQKVGVNDFIPKFDSAELCAAVKKGIEIVNGGKSLEVFKAKG